MNDCDDGSSVCRICLTGNSYFISILMSRDTDEPPLHEMISECTRFKVELDDILPKKICVACADDVCTAYRFKKRAENGYKQLCDLYHKRIENLKSSEKYTQTEKHSYSCEHCHLKFYNPSDLQSHRKSVHFGEGRKCPFCNKSFELLRELRCHFIQDHPDQYVATNLQCRICKRTFSRRDHLIRHLRNVHKTDPRSFTSVIHPAELREEHQSNNCEVVNEAVNVKRENPDCSAEQWCGSENNRTDNIEMDCDLRRDSIRSTGEYDWLSKEPRCEESENIVIKVEAINYDSDSYLSELEQIPQTYPSASENKKKLFHHDSLIKDQSGSTVSPSSSVENKKRLFLNDNLITDRSASTARLIPSVENRKKLYVHDNLIKDRSQACLISPSENKKKLFHHDSPIKDQSGSTVSPSSSVQNNKKLFLHTHHITVQPANTAGLSPSVENNKKLFLHTQHITVQAENTAGLSPSVENTKKLFLHENLKQAKAEDIASESCTGETNIQQKVFCDICKHEFSRQSHLRRHMSAVHLSLRPHICLYCEKKFTRPDHLKKHVINVHQIRCYKCYDCEKTFTTEEALIRHNQMCMKFKNPPKERKIYECEFCKHKFTSKHYLSRHRLMHTNRTFACQFCESTFEDPTIFREHERGHKRAAAFLTQSNINFKMEISS